MWRRTRDDWSTKDDRAELFYEGHGNSLYRVAEGANN